MGIFGDNDDDAKTELHEPLIEEEGADEPAPATSKVRILRAHNGLTADLELVVDDQRAKKMVASGVAEIIA